MGNVFMFSVFVDTSTRICLYLRNEKVYITQFAKCNWPLILNQSPFRGHNIHTGHFVQPLASSLQAFAHLSDDVPQLFLFQWLEGFSV